jgi:heterodisulfide reductase subunit A-like polyferredoxin
MNRNEILSSLKENPKVSVLIVGAGINGIGTFRDLALNGVDVLLVDRAIFARARARHLRTWHMAAFAILRTASSVWCVRRCGNATA